MTLDTPVATADAPADPSESATTATRVAWTVVGFALLSTGVNNWGAWSTWPGFAVVSPCLTLAGAVVMALAWTAPARRWATFESVVFVASLVAVVAVNAPLLAASAHFSTDAAAFNQRAAVLALHGVDPYRVAFHGTGVQLDPAADYWTYTLNGGHVDHLSYPAGSFLFVVPFVALGLTHLTTDWVDLAAWLVSAVALYLLSPRRVRWLAPLLVLATMFTPLFTFGDTDALYVPFLILAAWHRERFVDETAPRIVRWLAPLALGVACAIKQTPWFTVPFFTMGVGYAAAGARRRVGPVVARYLGLVAAPFVVLNLPYALWDPRAWLRGVLLPLRAPLVPDGQGLVSLVTHGVVHVLHPGDLQLAGAVLVALLVVAYLGWPDRLERAWLFVLPLVLFVPSRSLSTYLVDFTPAAMAGVLSGAAAPVGPRLPGRVARPVLALGAFAAAALVVVAFTASPLGVRVDRVVATDHAQFLGPVTLTLANAGATPLHVHVIAEVGSGHPVGFWRPRTGGGVVPAHSVERFTFVPPRFLLAPRRGESWLMEVMSASPALVVTTPTLAWRRGPRIGRAAPLR
ncbi:MAG TPA: hypothetical protein PLS29_02970 [Acidimicrobiales bacterium]|nr:MAG: hypothetical protein B7Z69_01275 [Actinobacteria bacterium 21-73-9]HQU25974.1 hypothetical protein [Acidimicrobiales bacterium]